MSHAEQEPAKVVAYPQRRFSVNRFIDYVFFLFATLSAVWLAWLAIAESLSWGWWQIALYVLFWLLLAYLLLPRAHRILTSIYVPGYFIGRARTSDGLLGDPINLAVLGDERQLVAAMASAGWTRADPVTARTSWRIVTSTLLRRSYDEAPVSPLLLFDRQQDVAYQQEVLGNPAKRHHVRFWRCPEGWLLPGGYRADWLAAGTFDTAVGLSLFTLQVTHRIDANIDIERDHIVSTLTGSDPEVGVSVIKDFSTGYHSRNGGGDAIRTDGDLPIIDLSRVRVPDDATIAPVLVDTSWQRPTPIWLGTALMLLRVLVGFATLALIILSWKEFVAGVTVEGTGAEAEAERAFVMVAEWILFGFVAGAILFYAVLMILVFRGSNWARITAMGLSAIVVLTSAVDYFASGVQVSLRANLLGLPLDILVLLALSSERARLWSRLPKAARRRPRAPEQRAEGARGHDPAEPALPPS